MQSPGNEGVPVTSRRGLSPAGIVLLVLGGCAVGGLAVAVILAAILFPVFARARESARSASCMSNMKQLSNALLMYCQDYDEVLPPKETWSDGLGPYTRNTAILRCPSDPQGVFSYAYNASLDRVSLSRIQNPATMPALFESSLHVPNAWDRLESFDPRHPFSGGRQGMIGYVDGHVKRSPSAPPASSGIDPP